MSAQETGGDRPAKARQRARKAPQEPTQLRPPSQADGPLYSNAAERALIGACLLSAHSRDVLARELVPEDFYRPAHAKIAQAILALHHVGHGVDPVTVAGWIADNLGQDTLASCGGLAELVALQADCPATTNAPTYAVRVRDRSLRRKLKMTLTEQNARVNDLAVSVEEIADDVRASIDAVEIADGGDPPMNVADFLAGHYEYDWLIPNLLERRDRLMLTGGEGSGKSELLRQMAVQLSAGIHPFAFHRFTPLRVLLIDVENSPQQAHRRISRLIAKLASSEIQLKMGMEAPIEYDPTNLMIEVRQEGIDLLTRADRRWFTSKVEAARPDIILSGPIYKMIRAEPKEEEPAAVFAAYMDKLRARYDTALILEAHSPHGTDGGRQRTLRPIGASLWMRWPEFGYGIRPAGDDTGDWAWVPWRGPRDDERHWPSRLRRGRADSWPWVNAILDDDEPQEAPF